MEIIIKRGEIMEKEEIKKEVFNQFRKINARPGQSIDAQWYSKFWKELNEEDREKAKDAIKEMEEEGLIKKQAMLSAETLVLTEEGAQKL